MMKKEIANPLDNVAAQVAAAGGLDMSEKAPSMTYTMECRDKDGNLKWTETFHNLVTTAGRNDLVNQYFKGSAYTAAFYVGLIDNAGFTAIAAADTMSSTPGWDESTAYSGTNRPALTLGTASGGSADNSASRAVFNMTGTATINGAFVTTGITKGGTAGVLYSAGSFASARALQNGDTLNVTVTVGFA